MSKFKVMDKRTFGQKTKDFFKSLLFWKGRSKGIIHTRDIELKDFREIFFPKSFYEKYSYLGSVPYNEDGKIFKAVYPLVLAMDHEAKPWWCPRWFLRFLNVFGNDKSIVRIRNWKLHNLFSKITKGIRFIDYKTKWDWYDLRISIHAPEHLQDLAYAIEKDFYSRGQQQDVVDQIKEIDPDAFIIWGDLKRLKKQLLNLQKKKQKEALIKLMELDSKSGLYNND